MQPVTDAMLRDPAPGDWPMLRHDYGASNFSPLDDITPDNWVTDLQTGIDPRPFHSQPDVELAPAAGVLPPISGLHTGIVTALEGDPDCVRGPEPDAQGRREVRADRHLIRRA